jgi:hypothetical protein
VPTEDRLYLFFNKEVSCLFITCIECIFGLNLISHVVQIEVKSIPYTLSYI